MNCDYYIYIYLYVKYKNKIGIVRNKKIYIGRLPRYIENKDEIEKMKKNDETSKIIFNKYWKIQNKYQIENYYRKINLKKKYKLLKITRETFCIDN
jgi:hypothetical protein